MEFKKTGIDKEMFKSQIASGITYRISFKQLRQLILILIGGVVITVFTHHYFHHDRYEMLDKSNNRYLDKMSGYIYRQQTPTKVK